MQNQQIEMIQQKTIQTFLNDFQANDIESKQLQYCI